MKILLLSLVFQTLFFLPLYTQTIQPPPQGKLYHGVFTAEPFTGIEELSIKEVKDYQNIVGKEVAWVYFSHNWFTSEKFPLKECKKIYRIGSVPYIRLMMRSNPEQNRAENKYNLRKIIDGEFDPQLKLWARKAKSLKKPLIVEFGTEVNGSWFSWNGSWHGGGITTGYGNPEHYDGPEVFRDAYQHVVDICDSQKADNITWVFHVDSEDYPDNQWNRLEYYYPGDAYVDIFAVSCYGPLTPDDNWGKPMRKRIDRVYARLQNINPHTPVIIAEFGCTEHSRSSERNSRMAADKWADAALKDILNGRWPQIIGFSWWNESWENGNGTEDTTMRLQDIPSLAQVFRKWFEKKGEIIQTDILY